MFLSSSLAGTFDPILVGISIVVAIAGAFAALDLAATAHGRPRHSGRWMILAVLAFGSSVWTMHFVGMLAYRSPVPISYDPALTALSLITVLVLSGLGCLLATSADRPGWVVPVSGCIVGLGIGGMHYIGMASMRMPATIVYDPFLVGLSVVTAIVASTLALWLALRRLNAIERQVGAFIMGLGVVGLHYIGMAAADLIVVAEQEVYPVVGLSRTTIAVAAGLGTFCVLGWIVLGSMTERVRTSLAAAAQEARHRSIVDTAVDPILVVDSSERIVSANHAAEVAFGYGSDELEGRKVSDLMPEPESGAEGAARQAHRKDGTSFPVQLSAAEWSSRKGRHFTVILRDLTEAQAAEEAKLALRTALEEERALLRTILEYLPVGLVIAEAPSGRILNQNAAADRLLGHEEAPVDDAADYDYFPVRWPDGRRLRVEEHALIRAVREGANVEQEEVIYTRPSGENVTLSVNAAPVLGPDGETILGVSTFIDVSERRELEEALRVSEARYRGLVEHQNDLVIRFDAHRRLTLVNEAVCRALSRPQDELIGAPLDVLFGREALLEIRRATAAAMRAPGTSVAAEVEVRTRRGVRWFNWSGSAVAIAGGAVEIQAVGRDVTDRKAAEKRVEYLAHHDVLTKLPNRALFSSRLGKAIAEARASGRQTGLILFDLDRLKTINDQLGHPLGDKVLRTVARRTSSAIRARDTAARIGGDEFAVVAPGISGPEELDGLARRVCEAVVEPARIEGQTVELTASFGVAAFPEDGDRMGLLMRHADLALYKAKESGRNHICRFDVGLAEAAAHRARVEVELRRAIERDEMTLHYQPQVVLATGEVRGVEALVRWNHGRRGLVMPGEFIAIAEASGIIRPLGAWVLSHACHQQADWRRAGHDLTMAVNVSPAEAHTENFIATVDRALEGSGVPGGALELEITEGLLIDPDAPQVRSFLDACDLRDIALAIDDFGIGYSSLGYLGRLPIDKIKIDRSFVARIGGQDDDTLIEAIVDLGHRLGKRVVAEGVEDARQLGHLREVGCDDAQGNFLSCAKDAESISRLLNEGIRVPA